MQLPPPPPPRSVRRARLRLVGSPSNIDDLKIKELNENDNKNKRKNFFD